MSIRLQLLADPNRVRSRLQRNAGVRHALEVFFHRAGHRAEAPFFDHVRLFVQNAVVTPSIAEIDADRDLVLGGLPDFLCACVSNLLVHALVSTSLSHHISRESIGSDAMNPDPDYSAAYCILRTD